MLNISKTNTCDEPPLSDTDVAVVLISAASNSEKFWHNNLHKNQFCFLISGANPLSFKVQPLLPFHQTQNPHSFQERSATHFSSFRPLLLVLECEEFDLDLLLPPATKPSSISPGTKGEKDKGLYVELPF